MDCTAAEFREYFDAWKIENRSKANIKISKSRHSTLMAGLKIIERSRSEVVSLKFEKLKK
jgi:hypothetical protein